VLNCLGRKGTQTSPLIGSDDQWYLLHPDSRKILERILQLY
jgi:hypothetical protein